jgi:hypothetical protein
LSGIMPREDAMNAYRRTFSDEQNDSFDGKRKKERDANIRINAEVRAALSELEGSEERRVAFRTLLECIQSNTGLLKLTRGEGSAGWVSAVFLIHRLRNLAARQAHWLRSCETWRPPEANLRPVFRSLGLHLLTKYPVPTFMDSVWDLPLGADGFRQQSWYIRLGRGVSMRELNLPLVLTRRMEHYVRQAPDHYNVSQALRYGEVRGMGGTERLAREVALGKLGQRVEHADFWRTVLLFLVAHPEMEIEHVNPIVDFVQYNKFAGEEVLTEQGTANRPAPWPNFSIKGRTMESVLRLVRKWHGDLSKSGPRQSFSWHKSGIEGYRFIENRPGEGEDLDWAIDELVESEALHAEGQAMHHCVFSYAQRCRRRETTIWSLRLRTKGHEKRMATIEVDPRRLSIIQVRARSNHRAGGRSYEIIAQWADGAGLRFDSRY